MLVLRFDFSPRSEDAFRLEILAGRIVNRRFYWQILLATIKSQDAPRHLSFSQQLRPATASAEE